MDIKRMYVLPDMRGKGLASAILAELENWAMELGYEKCILETGVQMHDAVGLYKKSGYKIIKNYGQYVNEESSVCFEKYISASFTTSKD